MLNTEYANLLQECEYAEKVRDDKLRGVDESLARRSGPDRAEHTGSSPAPENVEHEFVTYLDAMLAFDRPVVSIETPLVTKQDEVLALEVGTNRWIKASKLRQPLMQGVQDFAFAWAVFVTSEVPAPELGEGEFKDSNGKTQRGIPNRPYTKRIPFRTAFRDPLATSPWDMRFAGHTEIADKDDLIKRAKENPDQGWNLSEIEALPTDSDLQKMGRPSSPGNPSRNEIVFRDVWVADAKIDFEKDLPDESEKDRALYHGKIFTLACAIGMDGKVEGRGIRDPRPFFGPRLGPYNFIGAHVVCDDPFFLSPIQPIRSAISRLNRLNDIADAAAAGYKRLILVNDLVEDLAAKIKSGKHDHVFEVPGYEGKAAEQFEIGGTTAQMEAHLAIAKEKVDRGLGMGDVQRGAVTGQGSATETALATQNSAARMATLERNWRDGVSQVILTAAWYIAHDRRVKVAISVQEALQMGVPFEELIRYQRDEEGELVKDPWGRRIPVLDEMDQPIIEQQYVKGGTDDPDWFDSLDLEVQAYSMRRMDEAVAAEQVMFITNWVTGVLPQVPLMPWVDWALLHRLVAKLKGIPEMRTIARLDVAAEVAGSLALAQYAERLAQDDSTAGAPKASAAPKGQQSGPAPQQPMAKPAQPPGGGGQANAPKPRPTPLPGRSAGGQMGAKAASSAGAA